MNDNLRLKNNWKLWYHSINDNNWTNNSYRFVHDINTINDIQIMIECIKDNHLQNGMFFMMKNDIFPTWEYPDNREGSSISYKIPAQILKESWDLLLLRIIFEEILVNKEKNSEINGISISPKKEFNIIKLWIKNYDPEFNNLIKEYPPYFIKTKSIHRKHIN